MLIGRCVRLLVTEQTSLFQNLVNDFIFQPGIPCNIASGAWLMLMRPGIVGSLLIVTWSIRIGM